MSFKSTLLGAGAALFVSTGAALALPATAETDLNVRSGPGTEFPVVAAIPAGQTVDVGNCAGSWCRVNFAGGAGFASRSYLSMARGPGVAVAPGYAYVPGYAYDDDYDAYGYGYGPSFGFYAGPSYRYGWRGRRDGWRSGTARQGRTGTWQGRSGTWQGRSGWSGGRTGNWQRGQAGGNRVGNIGGGVARSGSMAPGSVSPQVSAPAGMGGGASAGAGAAVSAPSASGGVAAGGGAALRGQAR